MTYLELEPVLWHRLIADVIGLTIRVVLQHPDRHDALSAAVVMCKLCHQQWNTVRCAASRCITLRMCVWDTHIHTHPQHIPLCAALHVVCVYATFKPPKWAFYLLDFAKLLLNRKMFMT